MVTIRHLPTLVCLVINCTVICLCRADETEFTRQGHVHSTDDGTVMDMHVRTVASLLGCADYTGSQHDHLWFVYDAKRRVCATSSRWKEAKLTTTTTNYVYYQRKGKRPTPHSCSDWKNMVPASADGEYCVYPPAPKFLGCPIKIYCHDMDTGYPSEYVSLPNINDGEFPNLYNLFCTRATRLQDESKAGRTMFSKIRVNITTMEVLTDDITFTAGSYGHRYNFAEARDCYTHRNNKCKSKGTFHINTEGTGLLINPQQTWNTTGHEPTTPSVVRSADGAKIDLLCGGICGGCVPDGPLLLQRNPQEGPSYGEFLWNDAIARMENFFVGTSPEFDMALYTVCGLTQASKQCAVTINGLNITIKASTARMALYIVCGLTQASMQCAVTINGQNITIKAPTARLQ